MLDKQSLSLLRVLCSKCPKNEYKVLSIEELVVALPVSIEPDEKGVRECLKTLSDREFIIVKYEDENEICLSLCLKGRQIFETFFEEDRENKKAKKKYYFSAFFGAFFGSIITECICIGVWILLRRVFNAF